MTIHLPNFAPLDSLPGTLDDVTRADVVSEARSWKGTPYAHQHRAKGHAVDCVGLVIGVARELRLVAPDFDVPAYRPKPDGVTLLAQCRQFMREVPEDEVKPGHVLVLAFRREPQHLGILGDYLHGGFTLIHAYGTVDGKGHVEEMSLTNDRKGFRPIAAFALPGVR